MNSASIAATAPKVFRFSDVDEFRNSVRGLSVDFTPLAKSISAKQVILNLPGCDINLIESFPRLLDVQLTSGGTVVGFTVDEGVPIRFNGVDADRSVVVLGNSGSTYTAIERTARKFVSIRFTPEIQDRDWPISGPTFAMIETTVSAHRRLRDVALQVLSTQLNVADTFELNTAATAIKESLLAAADAAFSQMITGKWAERANVAIQYRVFRRIQEAVSRNLGGPIYSEDLAKQIGVSIRSMHNAVQRYRGMSLHQYLRLRRLWLVRQQLLTGAGSVKATALAFGFWHLGDFSRGYRLMFGETPSETLNRTK